LICNASLADSKNVLNKLGYWRIDFENFRRIKFKIWAQCFNIKLLFDDTMRL